MKSFEHTNGVWIQIVATLTDMEESKHPGAERARQAINRAGAASGRAGQLEKTVAVEVDGEAAEAIEQAFKQMEQSAEGTGDDHDGLDERGEPYYPQAQEEIEVEKREAGEQD